MPVSRSLTAPALLLVALAASSCLGSGNSINAYGGTRSLDTDDFGELDDQLVYGVDGVFKLDLPLLAVEGGWLRAEEDSDSTAGLTDAELVTDEYFVGLRLVPWPILIEPYGSIGVSFVNADLDATGTSDDDSSMAYYARLGAAFSFAFFRIGVDGRWMFGSDVDLDTIETDLDNLQLTGFIGVSF
jgi:hypothetical protein